MITDERVEAVASGDPRHVAEGLDAIQEALVAVICRTGKLPASKWDIPADISLRLGRNLRRIDAKYGGARERARES